MKARSSMHIHIYYKCIEKSNKQICYEPYQTENGK